ncbi:MAG: ATP-dependent helicase, partial [Proteobacteria bacterium]|nr:ATP-dependent helicase [Pseudomonadota bacterium]
HEAAHIKDVLCYMRLIRNPTDKLAFLRVLEPIKGVGPKTAERIYRAKATGDEKYLKSITRKKPDLQQLLADLDVLRASATTPMNALEQVIAIYTPFLMLKYPDDYPKRQAGLEQLAQITTTYTDIDSFLADLTLNGNEEEEKTRDNKLVLSTVHSSKGLEWNAVIIIDLVEDRFPSRKALTKPDDFEEERRLLYVACTRARRELALFVPASIYNRYNGSTENTVPSPFVRELPAHLTEIWQESYAGGLRKKEGAPAARQSEADQDAPSFKSSKDPKKLGYCRHKIFGKGKIIAEIGSDKYRVNFPGFGLKVIVADYLELL